jgi:Flp pilus assembly protein protease CpaA
LLLLLYTAVAGGVLALIVSAFRGQLAAVLQRTSSQIFSLLTCKRVLAQPQDHARGHERLPYAVAIAAGFALLILAQTCLPAIRITL